MRWTTVCNQSGRQCAHYSLFGFTLATDAPCASAQPVSSLPSADGRTPIHLCCANRHAEYDYSACKFTASNVPHADGDAATYVSYAYGDAATNVPYAYGDAVLYDTRAYWHPDAARHDPSAREFTASHYCSACNHATTHVPSSHGDCASYVSCADGNARRHGT